MTEKEIVRFKHLLQDYESYKKEVERLQKEIHDLEYKKHPFPTSSIIKAPEGNNPPKYNYDLIERCDQMIAEKEKEIDHYMFFIQKTDAILSKVVDPKVKEALIKIYVEGITPKEIYECLGYNSSDHLLKSIKSYLKGIS